MARPTLLAPFIGRDDLRASVTSDVAAHLVLGEPGIGKTRLLHEWLRLAVSGGATPIAVTLHDADAGDRYDVVREIVRALARDEMGVDAEAAYLRAARDALAAASAVAPLGIAVDDVWRAAPATLDALAYLVDRLQDSAVRWFFASRDDRGVTRAFAGLVRAGSIRQHAVPPLARAEADRLARGVDPTLDDARLARIYARSGGNPLYVELLASGDDARTAATLRAAVRDRLCDLGEPALRIARFVASGTHVTIERLAVVAATSPSLVRATCDGLLEGAILVADGEILRFRHDLIAEVTLRDATEEALRATYDAWFALAHDARERMRCLEGAGRWSRFIDEALDVGWAEIEHRERGAEAEVLASRILDIAADGDPRRALAHALRACARVETGRLAPARRDFAAFSNARDTVDPMRFGAAYGRFAIVAAPDVGSVGLPLLDELHAASEAERSAIHATLAHARMLVRYCASDVAGARETIRRARAVAATPLERLRQDVWDAYLGAQLDPQESAAARTLLAGAVGRAEALDAPAEGARACFMSAFVAHRDDDVGEAERWCRRGLAFREPKPRSVVAALRMQLCEYLFLRGDAWEASRILVEANDERHRLRRDARETIAALLAFAQALTGSLEAARRTIATVDDAEVSPVIVRSIATTRGWIAEMTADAPLAAREYERVIATATVAETSLAYAFLGRARVALGARDGATLARLAAHARVLEAQAPRSFRVATLLASLAALDAGDASALAVARTEASAERSIFDEAFTHLAIGEVTGDAPSLRRAAEAFAAIGTLPLADRARAAARRSGLRLAIARNGRQPLGERARSVAIGIAAGKTNAEIAAELHLSARTVEKYVSALLARFEVRSRVEIATMVLHGDLDSPREEPVHR